MCPKFVEVHGTVQCMSKEMLFCKPSVVISGRMEKLAEMHFFFFLLTLTNVGGIG